MVFDFSSLLGRLPGEARRRLVAAFRLTVTPASRELICHQKDTLTFGW